MESRKILFLTLTKISFDIMSTGEKKVEYRKPSKWIQSRLLKSNGITHVKFTNGYGPTRPFFVAEFIGWDTYNGNQDSQIYSNGLRVTLTSGLIRIYLGEISERKLEKQCVVKQ